MQGNCSDPNTAASLITTTPDLLPPPLPIKAAQCVAVIGDSAMQFLGGTQWLDNIYFRLQRTTVDPRFGALEVAWNAPRSYQHQQSEIAEVTLYMTNVTVQGQRRGAAQVLTAARGSKVLAQGVALCASCPLNCSDPPWQRAIGATSTLRSNSVTHPRTRWNKRDPVCARGTGH